MEVRDSTTPEQHAKSVAAGHELTDVSIRGIALLGIGLTISTIVIMVGLWWMFVFLLDRELARDPELPPLATERSAPPRPLLEENPGTELKAAQAAEDRFLNSYGWVDREKGVAHISIERAMEELPAKLEAEGKIRTNKEQPAAAPKAVSPPADAAKTSAAADDASRQSVEPSDPADKSAIPK